MALRLIAAVLAAASVLAMPGATRAGELLDFSETELHRFAAHGPWPLPFRPDPGNRASGNPAAIRLGQALFFDTRLSTNGRIACSTCHDPATGFQDGRATARGIAPGVRNTPGLVDVRHRRWFGWDGAHDSLWAASVRPLVDPREMGVAKSRVARLARRDRLLACMWNEAYGAPPGRNDEAVLVQAAKAMAAFQETLNSGPSAFDRFRDALARGDREAASAYPVEAQRGLRLFLGKGSCATCHAGPLFSNGEFADTGIPFFVKPRGVDSGRQIGIKRLLASPFNRLGRYSDDASGESTAPTRFVKAEHRNFGEFKVPTLRNLKSTAPYMHNGSLATLADVVRHYSEMDEDRLHADGERILKRLNLSAGESADLVAFLGSLSADLAPGAAQGLSNCRQSESGSVASRRSAR